MNNGVMYLHRNLAAKWLLTLLLLVLCIPGKADEIEQIIVLHTGDLHARLLPDGEGAGGFAGLATIIKEQKRLNSEAIVLDGGDMVQGTPVSTLFKGTPIYEVANRLRIEASVLGNHEFDYGWRQIQKFRDAAIFPLLCANVFDADGKLVADKSSLVFTIKGVRIAVIGLTTETLPRLAFPAHLEGVRIESIQESTRRELDALRSKADVFLVLAHLEGGEADALLRMFPEINAVITGHPHSSKEPRRIGNSLVVSVVAYGSQLGKLTLDWSMESRKVISTNWERIPVRNARPDPEVAQLVSEWEKKVGELVDIQIGIAEREFSKADVKELTERAIREELGVDFAFMNYGGVRDKLLKGPILARHIWNIHPFDNRAVVGRFKGNQLPKSVIGNRAINPDQEYTLAVSDFVAANQNEMGTKGLQFEPPTGLQYRDHVINWVKKQKVLK